MNLSLTIRVCVVCSAVSFGRCRELSDYMATQHLLYLSINIPTGVHCQPWLPHSAATRDDSNEQGMTCPRHFLMVQVSVVAMVPAIICSLYVAQCTHRTQFVFVACDCELQMPLVCLQHLNPLPLRYLIISIVWLAWLDVTIRGI